MASKGKDVKAGVKEVSDAMACNVHVLGKMGEELDEVKKSTQRIERLLTDRARRPGVTIEESR